MRKHGLHALWTNDPGQILPWSPNGSIFWRIALKLNGHFKLRQCLSLCNQYIYLKSFGVMKFFLKIKDVKCNLYFTTRLLPISHKVGYMIYRSSISKDRKRSCVKIKRKSTKPQWRKGTTHYWSTIFFLATNSCTNKALEHHLNWVSLS